MSTPSTLTDVTIREITPGDAEAAAGLSGELGYPIASETMRERIEALAQLQNRVVLVACVDGKVAGWIDVDVTHHLTADPRAEISGLVVSSEVRSKGIGRQLVARAEQWAAERGLKNMVVRSQMKREGAHRFYLREGYTQIKTSAVFSKQLV